ncbi:unnamed protein product [Amoebophrya sp. A25]|nr:unnamed protein product [Amoebophrya sp. A25]|eukprot:GSA25T00012948001.1
MLARRCPLWETLYEKLPQKPGDKTIEPVGEGAYGKVYKARNRLTGQIVAAKVTNRIHDEHDGVTIAFMRELQTMRRLACDVEDAVQEQSKDAADNSKEGGTNSKRTSTSGGAGQNKSAPAAGTSTTTSTTTASTAASTSSGGPTPSSSSSASFTSRRKAATKSCVQMVETCCSPQGEPVIVMEYCHAALNQLLQSEQHYLSMANIKFLVKQILEGVGYMHSLGILHRDLATKNILFNISGEIKVCDFGLSRVAYAEWPSDNKTITNAQVRSNHHKNSTSPPTTSLQLVKARDLEPPQVIVTPSYRSIELLLGERNYGPALDIWGAGCILGEILVAKGVSSATHSARRPFFYDTEKWEKGRVKVNEQSFASFIFQRLGRPTAKSWPRYEHLLRNYSGFENFDSMIKGVRMHRDQLVDEVGRTSTDKKPAAPSNSSTSSKGTGKLQGSKPSSKDNSQSSNTTFFLNNEAVHMKELFTVGTYKQVLFQLAVKDSLFSLLGHMLALNPDRRWSAEALMEHPWFTEKPEPAWEKDRFANKVDVDDGAKATREAEKKRELLLKQLQDGGSGGPPQQQDATSKMMRSTSPMKSAGIGSSSKLGALGSASKTMLGGVLPGAPDLLGSTTTKTNLTTSSTIPPSSNNENASSKFLSRSGKPLPPNWQKMFSKSSGKWYYANVKTCAAQWQTPTK